MNSTSPVQRLPVAVLLRYGALSTLAMALLGAGVVGLAQPTLVPALATPTVAWPMIAVGAMLESAAVAVLLNAVRMRRRAAESEIR